MTRGAGRARRPRGRGLRVREVDQRRPGPSSTRTSSRTDVALTTRSASLAVRRPLSAPRARARVRQRFEERRRRAAVSDDERPLRSDRVENRRIRRPALDAAVAHDERVHRRRVRVAVGGNRELVRRRDVGPCEAERGETADGIGQILRRGGKRHVGPVEPERGERGVVHPRRERVRGGPAEQADEPRRAADRHLRGRRVSIPVVTRHGARQYRPTPHRATPPIRDRDTSRSPPSRPTSPRGTPVSLMSRYREACRGWDTGSSKKRDKTRLRGRDPRSLSASAHPTCDSLSS